MVVSPVATAYPKRRKEQTGANDERSAFWHCAGRYDCACREARLLIAQNNLPRLTPSLGLPGGRDKCPRRRSLSWVGAARVFFDQAKGLHPHDAGPGADVTLAVVLQQGSPGGGVDHAD